MDAHFKQAVSFKTAHQIPVLCPAFRDFRLSNGSFVRTAALRLLEMKHFRPRAALGKLHRSGRKSGEWQLWVVHATLQSTLSAHCRRPCKPQRMPTIRPSIQPHAGCAPPDNWSIARQSYFHADKRELYPLRLCVSRPQSRPPKCVSLCVRAFHANRIRSTI